MAAPPIHVLAYGPDGYDEDTIATVEAARDRVGRRAVTWLNVDNAQDATMLAALERRFGIHPLTIEDIRNTRQRPKVEAYEGYLYVVVSVLTRTPEGELDTEQMSILLGRDWVVTVQEKPGDIFDGIRDRIRQGRVRVRSSGPDYLVYALLDAIVDAYFPLLEGVGARAEELEDIVEADERGQDLRAAIHDIRRDLLTLRRVAWPMRDALGQLDRAEEWVRPETRTFLRDVNDHATRVIDFVETNRELAATLMDFHAATAAQRTTEAMRVLTVVATIFIPLTFIAGVYGMNFQRMPELDHPWGYPAVLAVMVALGVGMYVAFKRRGWV